VFSRPLFISKKILQSKYSFFSYLDFTILTISRFIQGHAILISVIAMSFCLSSFMWWWLKQENARRDRWAAENQMFPENYTQEQKMAERTKGDNASFFRYTL